MEFTIKNSALKINGPVYEVFTRRTPRVFNENLSRLVFIYYFVFKKRMNKN